MLRRDRRFESVKGCTKASGNRVVVLSFQQTSVTCGHTRPIEMFARRSHAAGAFGSGVRPSWYRPRRESENGHVLHVDRVH